MTLGQEASEAPYPKNRVKSNTGAKQDERIWQCCGQRCRVGVHQSQQFWSQSESELKAVKFLHSGPELQDTTP